MKPIVVWSGGELLPPRDELTSPTHLCQSSFTEGAPRKHRATGGRPGRRSLYKSSPPTTKAVRCVVCGKQTRRAAKTVQTRKARGLPQVCSSRCAWDWRNSGRKGRAA